MRSVANEHDQSVVRQIGTADLNVYGVRGKVTSRLILDLAVLIGFTVISFWLVNRKMDWRAT